MTTESKTALPVKQDEVLTDDEIEITAISHKMAIRHPISGLLVWYGAFIPSCDYMSYTRAIESALLSKLRAPVADERHENSHIGQASAPVADERARKLWEEMGCIADDEKCIALLNAALESAPVADIRVGVSANKQGATVCLMQPHADGSSTVIYSETHPIGDTVGVTALACAPVAGEVQPVIHQHGFAVENQGLRLINESLDKQLEEAMTERDDSEETIDKLLDLVLGADRPEWSSAYDSADALIQVEDHMHALSVQAQASAPLAEEPFMYGIMRPDGKAFFTECCVSGDRGDLAAEVEELNSCDVGSGVYQEVALYLRPQPAPTVQGAQDGGEVRNAALEEAAGLVGGGSWGGTPDTVGALIAKHIRALKSQGADAALAAPKQASLDKDQSNAGT